MDLRSKNRLFFVPEIIQTSATDCGPATLKSALAGFGIEASYSHLRELCQTGVDGTSIDMLENLAGNLGLLAEQVMLPNNFLFSKSFENLPCLVVVALPNGLTHFVLVWRTVGPFVQIMDPECGRYWCTKKKFLERLFVHRQTVAAQDWKAWAVGSENMVALREKLSAFVPEKELLILLENVRSSVDWFLPAALDASIRFVAAQKNSKTNAISSLFSVYNRVIINRERPFEIISKDYWSVVKQDLSERGNSDNLVIAGAVLLRFSKSESRRSIAQAISETKEPGKPVSILTSTLLPIFLTLATLGTLCEIFLFRKLLDLRPVEIRIGKGNSIAFTLVILSVLLMIFEIPIIYRLKRYGREIEEGLRRKFLESIPKLNDLYFRSRVQADLISRGHAGYKLRFLPLIIGSAFRSFAALIITAAALIWISPTNFAAVIVATILTIAISFFFQALLREPEMRQRSLAGALSRGYLDALLGVTSLTSYSAQPAMQVEYQRLLTGWETAAISFRKMIIRTETVISAIGIFTAIYLVGQFETHQMGESLLFVYLALALAYQGQQFNTALRQFPAQRNIRHRLHEPISCSAEIQSRENNSSEIVDLSNTRGVQIHFSNVSVSAQGHIVLDQLELKIESGEHLAIVGQSGSGKSTLLGLLLGWHQTCAGKIYVNNSALTPNNLIILRKCLAWVDPTVQLWNRSLASNLLITGADEIDPEMQELLNRLPLGLQDTLGEGGSRLSAGQGQLVRLERAMRVKNPSLVLLDEPFRGLEKQERSRLLKRARTLWKDATVLCVTHDISAAMDFDRVIVMKDGCLVELGDPKLLSEDFGSHFQQLLTTERFWLEQLLGDQNNNQLTKTWLRRQLQNGVLT